jgi:sec-independent protein translocase protein TatB
MFDIGWSELLIIGVVALIVIGPRDLPEMFRQLGRFTAKLRTMARDFQRTMEAAADEAGVKDVAKDLKSVANPKSLGIDAVRDAATKFEKWDPLKPAAAAKSTAPVTALGPKPAAAAEPAAATPATPVGPETQALRDRQAERTRIAMEAAEKMRAVGKPAATPAAPAEPAPAPVKAPVTRKPRVAKAPEAAADPAPAARPRARKPGATP